MSGMIKKKLMKKLLMSDVGLYWMIVMVLIQL